VIIGEAIQVKAKQSDALDEFGNGRVEYRPGVSVYNVLVAPTSSQDLGADRPAGAATIMTFHFPKTYIGDLEGSLIGWKGSWWEVIGNPRPYSKEATPGMWNRPVQARLVEG
jgi:hypothetical protein